MVYIYLLKICLINIIYKRDDIMIKNMVWKIPTTDSEALEGVNEGNIETFKNTPISSLTKEELQNSCDGGLMNDLPVVVEFHDFFLNTTDVPDIKNLISIFHNAKKFYANFFKNDKKTAQFLDKALETLKGNKIRCLRISDKNTTGLLGVSLKTSSPWRDLVVNSNISDKSSKMGGSYGIGKNAAFACSDLRVVLYNTINTDGEEAFQGVIKIPSYFKDKLNHRCPGFLSDINNTLSKYSHLSESISFDNNYTRDTTGMDKYILGFSCNMDQDLLKNDIVISSVENFLYAFFKNKLEVKYNDVCINSDTLDSIIEKNKNDIEVVVLEEYEVLKKFDTQFSITIMEENDVDIFIKLDNSYKKKAAIVRNNGMKVFDMGHFQVPTGFSAVVVLKGDEVNGYFKKLENPEHNKWAFDRAENKSEAQRKKNLISDAIKNYVIEKYNESLEDIIDADGMNEYLPYAYIHGGSQQCEGLSNKVQELQSKKKSKKKRRSQVSKPNDDDEIRYDIDENGNIIEGSIDVNTKPKGQGGGGESPMPGNDIKPNPEGDQTQPINAISSPDGKFVVKKQILDRDYIVKCYRIGEAYNLSFKSSVPIKKGFVEIMVSTESVPMHIKIQSANINTVQTEFRNDKILLENIEKDKTYNISFDMRQKGDWTLEVNVYES